MAQPPARRFGRQRIARRGSARAGCGRHQVQRDRTEETTNYEISKAVKTSTVDGGTVKRLSVAVAVDGTERSGRRLQAAHAGRDEADRRPGEIGHRLRHKARGDNVQVVNMAFARVDMGDATPAPAPLLGLDGAYWFKIIEAAILSITALLIGLFVVRPLIARMFAPLGAPGAHMHSGSPAMGQLPAPGAHPTEAPQQVGTDGQPLAIPAPQR